MDKLLLSGAVIASLFSHSTFAIDKDKQLHLGVSTVIGISVQYYTEDWKTSLGTCLAVGAAKEITDPYIGGARDHEDMIYNTIGCGVGVFTGNVLTVLKQDDKVFLQFEMEF